MDNEFPDKIQTTTTTSTYHTTSNQGSGRIAFDQTYLRSLPSILRVLQIVLCFLYWVVLAAADIHHKLDFIIFVGIITMIAAIFFFVVFLIQINKKIPMIPWELSELIANFAIACLMFIAAIITSIRADDYNRAPDHGKIVFCTLVAWTLTLLFALSTFFSFRLFLAVRDRQSSETATTTTTTTRTITTTNTVPEYQDSKEQEKQEMVAGEAGTGGGVNAGTGTDLAY